MELGNRCFGSGSGHDFGAIGQLLGGLTDRQLLPLVQTGAIDLLLPLPLYVTLRHRGAEKPCFCRVGARSDRTGLRTTAKGAVLQSRGPALAGACSQGVRKKRYLMHWTDCRSASNSRIWSAAPREASILLGTYPG